MPQLGGMPVACVGRCKYSLHGSKQSVVRPNFFYRRCLQSLHCCTLHHATHHPSRGCAQLLRHRSARAAARSSSCGRCRQAPRCPHWRWRRGSHAPACTATRCVRLRGVTLRTGFMRHSCGRVIVLHLGCVAAVCMRYAGQRSAAAGRACLPVLSAPARANAYAGFAS